MDKQVLEEIKQETISYGKAWGNVGKLHIIDAVSRVLGLFLLIFAIILFAFALFAFVSVAIIDALATCMPLWAAALIVGCVYIVLIVLAVLFRQELFVHPFISLLSNQLIGSKRDLEIETLKAEHEADLQSVRLESKVDKATYQLRFYANLIEHVWDWIAKKISKD